MAGIPLLLASLSFATAVATYTLVLALLMSSVPRSHRSLQSRCLIAATAASVVWALLLAASLWNVGPNSRWIPTLDALHLLPWVLCLAALLRPSAVETGQRLSSILALAAIGAVVVVFLSGFAWPVEAQFTAFLVLPLIGLLGLEQVFRNANFEEQRFLKPLAIGIGVIFASDIFVYSQALLFHAIEPLSWSLRGFACAAVAPLLVLAVKRRPSWGKNLFVSRHIVFYSTSVTATGLYLVAMAIGGGIIGASGGAWSPVLRLAFFLLAGGLLFYVLFAQPIRNRVKVFIAKHFYRNRYDYREEWLRLTATLAGSMDESSLPERGIRALAAIIGSARGDLWMINKTRTAFELTGAWRVTASQQVFGMDHMLVKFLQETRWVVDTREYLAEPEKYANAFPSTLEILDVHSIFVPLIHADELVGIVRLDRPSSLGQLGFEDHDLLKTAGQQVAIFMIQARAQEELTETRQFEAFSRLTAFLMHDLKNMIAQQELIVGNAKRFKHRPEFVDDAMSTIERCVRRMRGVLERLQSAERDDKTARVDVEKVLYEVVSACSDRSPIPRFVPIGEPVWVAIDREKFTMAVTHAVRNAQDATATDGSIDVHLKRDGSVVIVDVVDTGVGMGEAFVRKQLFKPFFSTKGAKGMGIGAYQIRETLRAADGSVHVTSEPGKGTLFRMTLPLGTKHDSPADLPAA